MRSGSRASVERGRHADDDGVGLAEPVEVVGGLEPAARRIGADDVVADVADVALAAGEPVDLGGVGVEAEDGEPPLGEGPGQRQADVAEADDPDERPARLDPRPERGGWSSAGSASSRGIAALSSGIMAQG